MSTQNICNTCGANYEYKAGRWKCPACGAYKVEELSNEEVTLLYNAAQKLRLQAFWEAEEMFLDIIQRYPKQHEAYWGYVRAKYGIKYEIDFDGKAIPTCSNPSIDSFNNDKDFKKAIALADRDNKEFYQQQGEYIERIRKEWVEKARKEKPYDIFICYKDSDRANGIDQTQDSIAMQELYIHLISQGYRVFYSRESLRGKTGERFEPYIFNALSTAKAMIVYASSTEYVLSTWLRNEWYRYIKKIEAGEKQENSLIVAYDGFSPSELPTVLSSKQCIDASRNNRRFYGDLDTCIAKIINSYPEKSKNADSVPKSIPIASEFHEHKYKTQLVKGTCIARGYTLHRCDCGYEYKSNFSDLTDHDYGDCKVIAATCTQNGKKEYVCSVCGEIKTEILPQIPHTFTSWTERIHPSCTVDGESFRQCSSCGLVEKRKIDKLGHKFGQWQKNEQGIEVRHCLNCGYTETDKIAFLRSEERKKKKQEKALILNRRRELKKAKKLEKNGQKQEAMSIYYHYAYDAGIGFALFKVFEYEIEQPNLYQHAISILEKSASAGYKPAQKLLAHLDKRAFKSWFESWPRYSYERREKVLIEFKAWKKRIWDGITSWAIVIVFLLFMFAMVVYALSL